MKIDHLFLIVPPKGEAAAQELLDWGLTEGSSRVHPGQGTENRKFYFHNFFFELLWVRDAAELAHQKLAHTGLKERMNDQKNDLLPVGICLLNEDGTDALFRDAIHYQPDYFPVGTTIEQLAPNQVVDLPWLFRLPFRDQPYSPKQEPIQHANGVANLTDLAIRVPGAVPEGTIARKLPALGIEMLPAPRFQLQLEFDAGRMGQERTFSQLPLHIRW